MATLIAGSAGLLAIFSFGGAQLSRPVSADRLRHNEAERHYLGQHPAKQSAQSTESVVAYPIDAQLQRHPSVLDVIESKW